MSFQIIEKLLRSEEPCIRFKTLTDVLDEDPESQKIRKLQYEIKHSSRARALLSERKENGKLPYHPYAKWYGGHWLLVALADIGYPSGDKSLVPLRNQVYEWLLSKEHEGVAERTHPYTAPIKVAKGRARIHASLEGNALYSTLKLGLDDDRTDILADRLIRFQWPDGGWNCDWRTKAGKSSFFESLTPIRGLLYHAEFRGSLASRSAAERATEIFLKRHLYKRQSNGRTIHPEFVKLHYPCYWHYDILFGLKVMMQAGLIGDERCKDALILLKSKELRKGGFSADGKKYYRLGKSVPTGRSQVDWGPSGSRLMNEFVTVDALQVLKGAGHSPESYETILE